MQFLHTRLLFKNLYFIGLCLLAIACSNQQKVTKFAQKTVFKEQALQQAHIGISVYNATTQKQVYSYQSNKYFVPASNTKIFTCYAALKHLGDSIIGLEVNEFSNRLVLKPTGDPTLLHTDFSHHPVVSFIQNTTKPIVIDASNWRTKHWGNGWAWNDYDADYMVEKSAMPIYGNVVRFAGKKDSLQVLPKNFSSEKFIQFTNTKTDGLVSRVDRSLSANTFTLFNTGKVKRVVEVPFITSAQLSLELLSEVTGKSIELLASKLVQETPVRSYTIASQPLDSLLKPLMHRSDNFYAEQTLLMTSQKLLQQLNEAQLIDTLLKTDFKDLPQAPRWVDGSGLSRYNLITPEDFVWVLLKMKDKIQWQRITTILPTGNDGTLSNYYKNLEGKIFAKTGTLSGQVALSGYLITKKQQTLVFSILVNNHQTSATTVRRSVEAFVNELYEKY
ncbi:MAG: D-alanyl-D-alanine carboxypeptidase/D-alanyl-D-alanine endopeptidase [Chitinophagaceae bacterium]